MRNEPALRLRNAAASGRPKNGEQEKKMSSTVTIKPDQMDGDTQRVFEMIYETANELVPKIIENVARTGEKSSFSVRCEAGYNKDEELVVKVSGGCSLPIEPKEEKGEILEGKLRLW